MYDVYLDGLYNKPNNQNEPIVGWTTPFLFRVSSDGNAPPVHHCLLFFSCYFNGLLFWECLLAHHWSIVTWLLFSL